MPNYYNPYNFYPVSYQNPVVGNASFAPYSAPIIPQQMSGAQQSPKAMEWVEGEVGAKAYQMPQGWPANTPIPLWDSTDTVIWMKSWSPMGFPNPLQRIPYTLPEQKTMLNLPNGQSGDGNENMSGSAGPDMSQYVTKDDLHDLMQEIRSLKNSGNGNNYSGSSYNNANAGHQNGNNNSGNRGGNK